MDGILYPKQIVFADFADSSAHQENFMTSRRQLCPPNLLSPAGAVLRRCSCLGLAVMSLLALSAPGGARVIGHSEPAEPLSKERVMRATLPERTRTLWLAYLDTSQSAMHSDRNALEAERK